MCVLNTKLGKRPENIVISVQRALRAVELEQLESFGTAVESTEVYPIHLFMLLSTVILVFTRIYFEFV